MASRNPANKNGMRKVRLGELFRERREPGIAGMPVMSVTMGNGIVDRESLQRKVISDLRPDEHLLARKGDIAYNMMRMWQGVSGLVPYDCIVSPAYVVLEPQPGINSEYAAHLFKSEVMIRKLHRFSQGLTGDRLRLYFDQLKVIPVEVPSEEVQAFAAIVLRSVDDAIETTRKVIEQTRQLKCALLQELLTNGLPGRGRIHQHLKGIGLVPKRWNICPIFQLLKQKALLDVQDGNHGDLHPKEADFVADGVPFIAANCIVDGSLKPSMFKYISVEQAHGLRIGHTKAGDLILSHKGSVGLTAYFDSPLENAVLTPQTTYYRTDPQRLDRSYLRAVFEDDRFQSMLHRIAAQSTRDYVGITEQKRLNIPVPGIDEQRVIGQVRDLCDQRISASLAGVHRLLECKTALSQGLLTGRIPVSIHAAKSAAHQGTDAQKRRKE